MNRRDAIQAISGALAGAGLFASQGEAEQNTQAIDKTDPDNLVLLVHSNVPLDAEAHQNIQKSLQEHVGIKALVVPPEFQVTLVRSDVAEDVTVTATMVSEQDNA